MSDIPRPHRWPWILGILLLAVSGIGATWAIKGSDGNTGGGSSADDKSPAPTAVMSIGYVDVEAGVAHLHPTQQGIIESVAKEGDEVKKDAVILQIDPTVANLKVAEAQADLDAAEQQLTAARQLEKSRTYKLDQQEQAILAAEATRAMFEAEKKQKLEIAKETGTALPTAVLESLTATKAKLDAIVEAEKSKRKEIELIQPDVEAKRAEANKAAKKAQLDAAKWVLDQCSLKAPADGTILRVMVQKGEVLGPNPKVPAIQFVPKTKRIVRAEVLQEWASRVKKGQTVTIQDDTYAGDKLEGKVIRLSDWFGPKRNIVIEPFMVNDVRTLECLIEITSPDANLRIGQRVRVRIHTGS